VAFENEAGVCLPNDYVFFVTMVGNGGNPPCRLMPIEDWDSGYWSHTQLTNDLIAPCLITPELHSLGENWLEGLGVDEAGTKWDKDEWDPMRGSIAVAEIGCGLYFRMVVNGTHYGRVFAWGDHARNPPIFQPQLTFYDWLGYHLDAKVEGQAVHFLDGRL
jgi:hypothetical protein